MNERIAKFVKTHKWVNGYRARQDAAWDRLTKMHYRLVEEAARQWRPELDWQWHMGYSNGLMVRLEHGVEMYLDICPETGLFHIELCFEFCRNPPVLDGRYACTEETRLVVQGSGLGESLDEALAKATNNFNEARNLLPLSP